MCKNINVDEKKLAELGAYLKVKGKQPNSEACLIQALHKSQELFGYLPRKAMDEISSRLKVPSARVWGAATFYHYFSVKPRGRHIVSVCLGTACYVKGAKKVLERVKKELGIDVNQTTDDMLFTLDEKFCLGTCGISPVMMIDGKVYGELTPEKASRIIKDIVKGEKTGRIQAGITGKAKRK